MQKFKDSNLIFLENRIMMQGDDVPVMVSWEKTLMEKHADIVCQNGGDILEIGFGMGLSADGIQRNNINSHTIVELHQQIIPLLSDWAKDKPNVIILEGDWFDIQNEICKNRYDGIFFDTHEDHNAYEFKKLIVDKCIKNNGIFSYYDPYDADKKNPYNIPDLKCVEVTHERYGILTCPYTIFSNHQLK